MKRHFHMLISTLLAVMQGLLWIVHPFYRRLTSLERQETINSKKSILVFLLACLATILQFPLFIWYLSISNTSESLYIRLQGILGMWLAEILCFLLVSSQINVPVLQLEACAQRSTLPTELDCGCFFLSSCQTEWSSAERHPAGLVTDLFNCWPAHYYVVLVERLYWLFISPFIFQCSSANAFVFGFFPLGVLGVQNKWQGQSQGKGEEHLKKKKKRKKKSVCLSDTCPEVLAFPRLLSDKCQG